MIFKGLLKASITASLLRSCYGYPSYLKRTITGIFRESRIFRFVNGFYKILRLSFCFNVFKEFVELIKKKNPTIVYDSKVVRWIVNCYEKWTTRIIDYLRTSLLWNFTMKIKKEFGLYLVKTAGAILILAVFFNSILSFMFQRGLGTIGFTVGVAFLIIGILWLLCDVDWMMLKKESIILKVLSLCVKGN